MRAEQALREGKLELALSSLQEDVRKAPADAKLRVFLFQVFVVLGQWERALKQLQVAAALDPAALPMAQTYREVIGCEVFRSEVFAGRRMPAVLGEPEPWMGPVLRALELGASGEHEEAERLRSEGFEAAPASVGTLDGTPFTWLCDSDSRLGPIIEVIVRGRYYFLPLSRVAAINLEGPKDLRDLVWAPAQLTLTSGQDLVAFLPARYAGSEACDDDQVKLGRKTVWQQHGTSTFTGLGQRMLSTDAGDYSLLELRRLEVSPAPTSAEGDASGHA